MDRIFLTVIGLLVLVPTLRAQQPASYAKQVRPFLAKYCLECHNAKSAKFGLNLETVKAIHEGSDGGSVLEPGKPDDSRIVLLVEGKDKPVMPPKEAKFQPKKEEIGVVRSWIAAGAKDDSAEIKVAIPDIKPRKHMTAPVSALTYSPGGGILIGARGSKLVILDPMVPEPVLDPLKWAREQKWWNGESRAFRITALTSRSVDRLTECVVGLGSPGEWGDLLLVNSGKPPKRASLMNWSSSTCAKYQLSRVSIVARRG